jgi:hypothetical protein
LGCESAHSSGWNAVVPYHSSVLRVHQMSLEYTFGMFASWLGVVLHSRQPVMPRQHTVHDDCAPLRHCVTRLNFLPNNLHPRTSIKLKKLMKCTVQPKEQVLASSATPADQFQCEIRNPFFSARLFSADIYTHYHASHLLS